MAETFASLAERIRAQDPDIIPEDIEKLIAYRVSELVSDLFDQIAMGHDTTLLRQAIHDRFGLPCEIVPAMSIYVNVTKKTGDVDVEPFSSSALDEAILRIMEKDFSQTPEEEILRMVTNVMNNCSGHFLEAVVIPNPELQKLFARFMQQFRKTITIITDPPVTLRIGNSPPPKREQISYDPPGMYI